ncbi:hypothetical protein [Acidianus sp. HS-5]|uniref:hypothetical protein n=1 Tax=Acidianus sp. HS-5 TaxID=2886040 RepID=UPI001F2E6970|nr:hypothetical protein [Acidianus sp. HS-5]BDC18424.1 hypothetical protein HS5_13140 [Acidianus sp. HS-5]
MVTEGYFVKYQGIIWAVKGCYHPEGYVVAVPRKIGEKKIKKMREAIELVKEKFPHLMKYMEEIGFKVPLIPLAEAKVLDPFKISIPQFEDFINRFLDVGITGSYLYEERGEDLDLISFNSKNYEILADMRKNGVTSSLLEVKDNEIEGLSKQDFSRLKANRLLEGKYKGTPYTFKIVECEDFGKVIKKEKFEGVIKIERALKPFSLPVKYLTEEGYVLTSFRTRYTELKEGLRLYVKGTLLSREKFEDLDLDVAQTVKIM